MNPVLKTKLFIPSFNHATVLIRPRLIEHLNASIDKKLIVVSAAAGFGKTTCLAQWVKSLDQKVGWLSLDTGDNDPFLFWTYLLTAFQHVVPEVGMSAMEFLKKTDIDQTTINLMVTTLINDIVESHHEFFIILDDYHDIKNSTIHQSVKFLIDHAPRSLHLIISSRSVPPIALSRLRVKSLLSEFYSDDLRFSPGETDEFLTKTMNLDITKDRLKDLISSSEGWITGLQIVALSLKAKSSTMNTMVLDGPFMMIDQHLMAYFVEEVLSEHSKEIQSFLMKTSILNRLSGSLCDALTGKTDSAAILDSLHRSNLFIAQIDKQKSWYRYHHLFAGALRAHLARQLETDEITALHEKAYHWYNRNNLPDESFQHAIKVNHHHFAATLIERYSFEFLRSGQFHKVLTWIETLPSGTVDDHPVVSIIYAWILFLSQMYTKVDSSTYKKIDQLLKTARMAHDKQLNSERFDYEKLKRYNDFLQLYLDNYNGVDLYKVIGNSKRLLKNLDSHPHGFHSLVGGLIALNYYLTGDIDKSFEYLEYSQSYALEEKNHISWAISIIGQASILRKKGRLHQSIHVCRQSEKLLSPSFFTTKNAYTDNLGFFNLPIARSLYEKGHLSDAKQLLDEGLKKMRHYTIAFYMIEILALQLLISLHEKTGRLSVAGLLSEIEYLERTYYKSSYLTWALRIRSTLFHKKYDADTLRFALGLSKDHHVILTGKEPRFLVTREKDWFYFAQLTLIRVYIAQCRIQHHGSCVMTPHEIIAFIDNNLDGTRRRRLDLMVIELLILKASIMNVLHDTHQAVAALKEALILAEPEGIMQIFINEGPALAELLNIISARDKTNTFIHMIVNKLSTADEHPRSAKDTDPENPLLERFSRREVEILKQMNQDLSNQEIADELCLSIKTIKWHNYNIYRKLNVKKRFQATLKAKALGLL